MKKTSTIPMFRQRVASMTRIGGKFIHDLISALARGIESPRA